MSRFSKLETGTNEQASTEASAGTSRDPGNAAADDVQYDYDHYLREAEDLFYGGDARKALRNYSRAIQADHAKVEPWIGQALCLLEMKQFGEATVWVKRGLELFPEDPRLISLEGACFAHQGMVQRGLGASDYAIRKNGSDPLVWIVRAQVLCLADNRNYQFCLDKASEHSGSDNWRVPALIGLFLTRQKKWSQAVEYLKRATSINTRNPHLWSRLGHAYEKLGLSQPALDAYAAANDLARNGFASQSAMERISTTPMFVRFFRRLFH